MENSDINATRYGRLELIASCYALAAGDGHLRESLNESPEVAANARLIAEAPKLLSIARRWVALDAGAWHPTRYAAEKKELIADTVAVIAKAEGQ